MARHDKSNWSKLVIPPTLSDVLLQIAKKKKIPKEDIHVFIYETLLAQYPREVNALREFYGDEWDLDELSET